MRLSELTTPQVVQLPYLVKCDGNTAERMLNAHLIKVKSRPQPCRAAIISQRCSDTDEEPMVDPSTVTFALLFLSGGRMCENISDILLLTAPSGSWRIQAYFRD